jgi:hypothetical protein
MATQTLDVSSIISSTGWTGATVGSLSASDDSRATGGTADELISAELDDSPGDFDSQNSIQLHVEARTQGSVSRAKQLTIELLDSGDNVLQSFSTGNLTGSDDAYSSSAFSRADSQAVIDGYRIRATVTESGGMADSATVEIDRLWTTLDYDIAVETVTGSGSPQSTTATASGSGVSVNVGSGDPQAQAATASGFGVSENKGSGTPQAQTATADGSGTVETEAITGAGTPQADTATASGTGINENVGSGSPQAQTATATGAAVTENSGTGSPQAQTATAEGSGQVVGPIFGSGSPQAQSATADGTARTVNRGSGNVQASVVSVSGNVITVNFGSGAVQAETATAQGGQSPPPAELSYPYTGLSLHGSIQRLGL